MNVGLMEKILCLLFGLGLIVLAFRFVHKEKLSYGFLMAVFAVLFWACSLTWFQGLLTTGIISTTVSTLKTYGDKLESFHNTVSLLSSNLDSQQRLILTQQDIITNQYNNISLLNSNSLEQQRVLLATSTNLEQQQKTLTAQQKKLEDVEYWVQNLYSKKVYEQYYLHDTNHVLMKQSTNGQWRAAFKLEHIVIPGSVQCSIDAGPKATTTRFISIEDRMSTFRNVAWWGFANFDTNSTMVRFQYIQDTRDINLAKDVRFLESEQLKIDDMIILLHWDNKKPAFGGF